MNVLLCALHQFMFFWGLYNNIPGSEYITILIINILQLSMPENARSVNTIYAERPASDELGL